MKEFNKIISNLIKNEEQKLGFPYTGWRATHHFSKDWGVTHGSKKI